MDNRGFAFFFIAQPPTAVQCIFSGQFGFTTVSMGTGRISTGGYTAQGLCFTNSRGFISTIHALLLLFSPFIYEFFCFCPSRFPSIQPGSTSTTIMPVWRHRFPLLLLCRDSCYTTIIGCLWQQRGVYVNWTKAPEDMVHWLRKYAIGRERNDLAGGNRYTSIPA